MALIRIDGLPAITELEQEGIRIQNKETSPVKPLQVAVLNLMPLKEQTERQLLRRIATAGPLAEVTFVTTESYHSKHVDPKHLQRFYTTFSQIWKRKWDGLIITGAPVENMEFEEVAYWQELTQIMEWSRQQVRSVLHICWGAQAGLYYHYGISKKPLRQKQFGIFEHEVKVTCPLTRHMDNPFAAPHSRHTCTPREEVLREKRLQILCESPMAGVYLMLDPQERHVFVTGHSEYEADTLEKEYRRDLAKGLPIQKPYRYFPEDDDTKRPVSTWKRHSETLFHNWLTYYVSQA